jgi:hypothetical protein
MPAPLRAFNEADWQEWLLDGPDPAADAYVDMEAFYALPHPAEWVNGWVNGERRTSTVIVGIGDRPELVAHYRRMDAHKRWSAARVAWLKERGLPWLDTWIDDMRFEHLLRMQTPEHDREGDY